MGLVLVFGGTRCSNQGGIHCTALFEHQASLTEDGVNLKEYFIGQLVLFQSVTWNWGFAEAQDGALAKLQVRIGRTFVNNQADKLAIQLGIQDGFFHIWVRKVEPLRYEVGVQHRLHRKR